MAKSTIHSVLKFRRLGRRRTRLLIEAARTLVLVSIALRLLPFRRAIRLGSLAIGRETGRSPETSDCIWAVEAAARRLPWPIVCIQKGIAAQRMLRRRGVDARLHYGARHGAAGKLEAHVWVSVGGDIIIGGAEAPEFAEVACYP